MKTQNKTIVKFHVGRGGRFYNQGHLKFVGCEPIDKNSTDNLFIRWENEEILPAEFFNNFSIDDFFNDKPFVLNKLKEHNISLKDLGELIYTDSQGEEVGLTLAEAETGIGTINIDNDYDTTYTCYLSECDFNQLAAIAEANHWNLKSLIEESEFFEDNSVIDILQRFNKLTYAISEDYSNNTLEYVGIEEIIEDEYDLYDSEYQEEIDGKFYKLL